MSIKPISGYMCNGEFFKDLSDAERRERYLKLKSDISDFQKLIGDVYIDEAYWLEDRSYDERGREYILSSKLAEYLINHRDFIITFLRGIEE